MPVDDAPVIVVAVVLNDVTNDVDNPLVDNTVGVFVNAVGKV